MKRCQVGEVLLALGSCAALTVSGTAQQNPHTDRPPQHQVQPHVSQPHPHNQNANHPPANTKTPPGNANRPPANQFHGADRPPATNAAPSNSFNNANHPPNGSGARLTPRQQAGVGAPRPWVDQMRSLTPKQRDQVLENSRAFQNLSPEKQNKIRQQFNQWDKMTPQQRADQQIKEDNWRRMTPEQRDHIKNDVLPQWKQMPWERQQVMKQKLGVLQNMPESARNQRLNDPSFTQGMSEDEKSMLKDLSHTHVGGAPEPPGE
jgi:Protein of unknown function (DUF3106)